MPCGKVRTIPNVKQTKHLSLCCWQEDIESHNPSANHVSKTQPLVIDINLRFVTFMSSSRDFCYRSNRPSGNIFDDGATAMRIAMAVGELSAHHRALQTVKGGEVDFSLSTKRLS